MVLVENNYIYWEFIRNLRNLDGVREGFIIQDIIEPENHQEYMKKYSDCFYICLVDGIPAGYVGVIQGDIRVATCPSFQGKGVGKFMINQIMNMNPAAYAKVKINNQASLRLFKSCGFEKKYFVLEKES
jgi:ribosomal protein S18 acetylase RimI-like enzyme